jgi:uncharacterized protein YciI
MRFLRLVLSLLLVISIAGAETANTTARYYVVFLRPLPSRKTLPKEEGERIQSSHMANIRQMAQDGVLVAAGPMEDRPSTISGIFVLKAGSLQEAHEIAAKDPTVAEHRNAIDVHAWQGPAGIGDEYFRLHKTNPKTPENMQVHPLVIFHRGTAWEEKQSMRTSQLAAHARYIANLRKQGKLSGAGQIAPPDEMFGLVILRPMALEEAQHLLGRDPAVQAGVLRAEYHRWWVSDHVLPW